MKTILILLTIIISVMSTICYAQTISTTYVQKIEQINPQTQSAYSDYSITIKFECKNIWEIHVASLLKDKSYKVAHYNLNKKADIYFYGVIRNQTATAKEIKEAIEKNPREFNDALLRKFK